MQLPLQVSFSPWLVGRRCPQPKASATAGLRGLSSSVTRSDIARAVLEGVAFGMRACLEASGGYLADGDADAWGGGDDGRTLSIVGGGAQSQLMCQIMAGVLGRPLRIGPTSGVGVVGAAMAGFSAIGLDMILVQNSQLWERNICHMPRTDEEMYSDLYNEVFTLED